MMKSHVYTYRWGEAEKKSCMLITSFSLQPQSIISQQEDAFPRQPRQTPGRRHRRRCRWPHHRTTFPVQRLWYSETPPQLRQLRLGEASPSTVQLGVLLR